MVLLAEDDPAIAEPLSRALEREGYEIHVVTDGPSVLDATAAQRVDLLVLDLGLPGMDGLEVCRRLRAAGTELPVLMLTARTDEVDFVVGLDAGADDYVAKPFRLAELLARVRAMLRRSADARPTEVNGVRVDEGARRAWLGDAELDLTPKEFAVLEVLLSAQGDVVTPDELVEHAWDEQLDPLSNTVRMTIMTLRRKLGDPPLIETVRGSGYRV